MSEQNPSESSKAFHAYECYRDLGTQRTIAQAYARYRKDETALKPSASFLNWKSDFDWDDRVKEFDLVEETRRRDFQRDVNNEKYQSDLEQFRQLQLSSGKTGAAIATELKRRLLKFIETNPQILDLRDALIVARIIATLELPSVEQWAKALHIDILLQQMLEDSEVDC